MKRNIFSLVLLLVGMMTYGLKAYSGEAYKVDTDASEIVWRAEKHVGNKHFGTIKVKEGNVVFEKGLPVSGAVVMDMDSIFVKDLEAGSKMHKKLMAHLRSNDFFKIKKYPITTVTIVGSERLSKNKVKVSAKLKMRGVEKPLSFLADINQTSAGKSITANFEINRKKWNLKYGAGWFKRKLDSIIKDEIKFEVSLKLKK